MPRLYNIVAAGRAYTDVVGHVSKEFLQTHHIPLDGQRQCLPAELKLIQSAMSGTQFIAGGPGANTVAIAASLGGRTGFFGKVFQDAAGEYFIKDFALRNVAWCCPCFSAYGEMSATCLVLLHDELRSFAYHPGCGDNFSLEDFEKFDFENTDFFLLEAHLLTSDVSAEVITQALQLAKNKCSIVINLQGITHWNSEVLATIVTAANIIVGNQVEQAALTTAIEQQSLTSPATQLRVTTQGAAGAQLHQGTEMICKVPAVVPNKLISVVGAGDGFIAGFLMALSAGEDMTASMRRGTQTAAAILEVMGARPEIRE